MLALLVLVLLVPPIVPTHVLLEQVALLLLNLVQLRLQRFLCLLELLLLLLELLLRLVRLLTLLDGALDKHVDVLEDGIFRSHGLNALVLLLSDQILLVDLLLELAYLGLKLLVLALGLD